LALDFETTGLDANRERIVEVGAIRFVPERAAGGGHRPAFRIEGAFASLVHPGIRIPSEVIAIHGIRDADVAASPRFGEIAPILMALASGARIVAHNAPFDVSFLRAELFRAGLPPALNTTLDTRLLAKRAFPGLSSYRLVDLALRMGIEAGQAHRAVDDARTCLELMLVCAEKLEPYD
jgi:DNA polymerase III subunit epsilon